MSKLAFIFPGQGSQYVGMGKKIAQSWDSAHHVFELASDALGFDLASICWDDPEEKLNLTEYTQPALLATSVAVHNVLVDRGVKPDIVAGHSVGEYTALVSSGGIEFQDAVRLVQKRGRYMQEAVPSGSGAMAAILGLSRTKVEEVCRQAQGMGVVGPANFNSPSQTVIAGDVKAVDRASSLAREQGAKRVIPLSVSVPSHCLLMQTAARHLAKDLEAVTLKDLSIPVVANAYGKSISKPGEVREALIRQLESPVLWVDSIEEMNRWGVDIFIEVGPGKVLTGLVKRIIDHAGVFNVEDPESLEKTLDKLKSHLS